MYHVRGAFASPAAGIRGERKKFFPPLKKSVSRPITLWKQTERRPDRRAAPESHTSPIHWGKPLKKESEEEK